jgi:hypothetical protein
MFDRAGDLGWLGSTSDVCEWVGIACDIEGKVVQL